MTRGRRTLRRHLARALAALLAVAVTAAAGAAGYYYRITRAALPQVSGSHALPGLRGDAEVVRDRWGIAHVFAATDRDAYLAQGYITAQDRLWQMDLLRRSAAGELAEVFGERAYAHDLTQRTLGLRDVAERALASMPPAAREALDLYALGVNRYIEEHRDALPFEFRALNYAPRPWSPVDSLVIGKLMAQTLGTTWQQDLMRQRFRDAVDPAAFADLFVERTPYDVPFVGADTSAAPPPVSLPSKGPAPPPPTGQLPGVTDLDLVLAMTEPASDAAPRGSNNWVVAGARSETGRPLLANDPHLELGIPPIWHAVGLHASDGSLAVAGVTFPGAPGVVIGHNGRVGWGVTNFNPDVQDVYAEEFDESGRLYRTEAGMVEAAVRRETIRVRVGSWDATTEDRSADVVVTRHGPIVSGSGTTRYALRWTALDPVAELTAFYLLNRAGDWGSFVEALRQYPGPMQNFVYADVSGNIGYYAAGNVPVRRAGTGDVPYRGDSPDGDWTGFVPFDELPHALNPAAGYVATANNRVVGTSDPHFYTHEWISPFRARRIGELIESGGRHSPASMSAIQADVYSYPHAVFAREAAALAAKRAASGAPEPEWAEIADLLGGWDGRLTADSVPAAVADAMRKHFNDRVLGGRLGPLAAEYKWFSRESLLAAVAERRPPEWLPADAGSWESLVLESYRDAVSALTGKLGAGRDGWRYGRLHVFAFAHPLGQIPGLAAALDAPALEMDGGSHTVKAFIGDRPRVWGSSIRLVLDFADLDRSTLNLTTGESGLNASPHYVDQVEDWRFVRPHAFPFSEGAVRAAAADALRLTPAP